MEYVGAKQAQAVTVLRGLAIHPSVVAALWRYTHAWRDGTCWRGELIRIGEPGSYQQLRAIFGLAVGHILAEFQEQGLDLATLLRDEQIPPGIPVSKNVLKDYLYAVAGHVSDDGDAKTLSEMDKTERSRFFENIRTVAAGRWCIQIPDPDPLWRSRTGL
jgi:hypothetical protein